MGQSQPIIPFLPNFPKFKFHVLRVPSHFLFFLKHNIECLNQRKQEVRPFINTY